MFHLHDGCACPGIDSPPAHTTTFLLYAWGLTRRRTKCAGNAQSSRTEPEAQPIVETGGTFLLVASRGVGGIKIFFLRAAVHFQSNMKSRAKGDWTGRGIFFAGVAGSRVSFRPSSHSQAGIRIVISLRQRLLWRLLHARGGGREIISPPKGAQARKGR